MSGRASLVGFGDAPATMAHFSIRIDDRSGELADWSMTPNIVTHVFPGGFPSRSEIEVIGFEPSVVTWRLWLASRADYHRLLAQIGKTGNLTVLAGRQSHLGVYHEVHGVAYEDLPYTTLMNLSNQRFFIDGDCEVEATWQRQIDPATALGVPS